MKGQHFLQCRANSFRSYQQSYFDILSYMANHVSKKLFPLACRYFVLLNRVLEDYNETTGNIK